MEFPISIHAPRVGSDQGARRLRSCILDFNPRSPCGERHLSIRSGCRCSNFNPRSPCGERLNIFNRDGRRKNFNPRSPCGERRWQFLSPLFALFLFQSTLPVWGATTTTTDSHDTYIFQSTLPVWGATISPVITAIKGFYFNPRSPCGERLVGAISCLRQVQDFNPRSPCGERRCQGKVVEIL